MPNIPPVKLTLFGGHQKSRSNYQLTEIGKRKAEDFNITGTKGEIVIALESIGPCTLSELSNETKMSPTRVKMIVQTLMRDGWVRKVSGEE